MLIMKGTPDEPKCGFSGKVVAVLKKFKVKFGFFNILEDNEMREQLKVYAKWKTYPQLWIKGKLQGGCDIVEELVEDGEFEDLLKDFIEK